jgi:hypothetical protein
VSLIFISYARNDEAVVLTLAEGLQRAGFDVWRDTNLGAGEAFRGVIEDKLRLADVILVVWSKRAKLSRWVPDEAEIGVQRGILLPLRIDASPLPLGFGGFNTLNFSDWGGNFGADEWRRLLSEVDRILRVSNPSAVRPPIRILPQALLVACGWGAVIGGTIWLLYALGGTASVTANLLGHPAIDAFVLAFIVSLPVALWSAVEVKRAGFASVRLIVRRSLRGFVKGAIVALLLLVAAVAAGAVRGSAPREVAIELMRIFLAMTAAATCILAVKDLVWFAARRGLGAKPG